MRWEQPIQYASLSDIGFRRRMNQDAFVVQMCSEPARWRERGHLFLVADGMGGHAVGELASKIAVDTIPHTFFKSRHRDVPAALREAIEAANGAIYERGKLNRDFERMGTTCAGIVLGPQGVVVGHVGDSRVYRVRRERIDQLTFDHSLQWELLRQGKMKPEDIFLHEPRHIITRSLGPEPTVKADVEGPFPVQAGDVFVLCSDGLTGHMSDEEIGTIVRELPPTEAVRLLVNLTNLRGGSDNVTVLVVRIGSLPAGVESGDLEAIVLPADPPLWPWMLGLWVVAAGLTAGVSTYLAVDKVAGLVVFGISLIALVLLLAFWWQQRRSLRPDPSDDDATVTWSPYRTAPARLTRGLLSHLATVESELLRTAGEERWPIDQAAHAAAWDEAKRALENHNLTAALRHHARAIEILMVGVHQHRKDLRRARQRRPREPRG